MHTIDTLQCNECIQNRALTGTSLHPNEVQTLKIYVPLPYQQSEIIMLVVFLQPFLDPFTASSSIAAADADAEFLML